MVTFVVSAPRSGMNWVRYCVEHFYGQRTQGKTSLIEGDGQDELAFRRSHDALGRVKGRKGRGAWQPLDPEAMQEHRVVLILRDPLETYARMAKRALHRFKCYSGNIQFYARANTANKRVYYYNDLVSSPDVMAELLEFMDITPAEGHCKPTRARIAAEWEQLGANSRQQYDVKQAVGGGSKTKDAPQDFTFHQRALCDWNRSRAWRHLRRNLSDEEFALLDRFNPPTTLAPPTIWDRITDLY